MTSQRDPYGDILEDRARRTAHGPGALAATYKKIAVGPGVPLLHRSTGLRGRVWKFTGELVVLQDAKGGRHTFENHAGAFAYQGETVTLVQKPRSAAPTAPATKRSAAGGVVSSAPVARVAQPSRMWVEGNHDARFMERVWGDELRELGIVVEPMGGIDDLVAAVAEFDPRPDRRLAILVDHLVPGSKETRLAEQVRGPDVLVVGHVTLDVVGLRGHTPGSVALVYREPSAPREPQAVAGRAHVVTGDSLFPGGVGATRTPEDFATLYDDVVHRLFDTLPDDTWVYPGHGDDTTLGAERPHLRAWHDRAW